MSGKRLIGLFGAFLLFFSLVVGKLYLLAGNVSYAENARAQTVTTLDLPKQRGNIYDTQGRLLTGAVRRWYALAVPGDDSYVALFQYVPYRSQPELYRRAQQGGGPFLIEVDRDLTSLGIFTVQDNERWLPLPVAVHLLGYLDGSGHGVTGVEAAFDDVLGQAGSQTVQCVTSARGSILEDTAPELKGGGEAALGVKLTLDERVQRIIEGVAAAGMDRGSIVVLDCATAAIRGAVSMPQYDPEHVEKSIEADDTSLINRCFSAYNVGSVFKPLMAAAALDAGWSPQAVYECKGWIEVDGQIYRCVQGIAHGEIGMREALEQSCNCYFVELGQWLGARRAHEAAQKAGFGQANYFSASLKSAAGSLPGEEVLASSGELANFSFGQGALLASPVQVAAMMNLFAQGGVYREPKLVDGLIDEETGELTPSLYGTGEGKACSPQAAAQVAEMLKGVVSEGLGQKAQPTHGEAAGKTGTAQTGRFNKEGEELTDIWFAGYWPADDPQYTVAVLLDSTTKPSGEAAALFRQVCCGLAYLQDS